MLSDMRRFQQVFLNLLSNSIKFTRKHGLIQVIPKLWQNKIELTVKDNGIGMSKQEKDNLFKLFNTMKNDKYSETNGIGLGLCISRMIVESFGGKIDVESEPEIGSSFTYYFNIEMDHLIDSSEDSDEREDKVANLSKDEVRAVFK